MRWSRKLLTDRSCHLSPLFFEICFTIMQMCIICQLDKPRYRFTCQCEACTEDWPLTTSLVEQSTTFSDAPTNLLRHKDINCEALDAKNELLRDRVEAELSRGRVSSAIVLSCDRVRISSDNLRRPHALHIMGRLALVQYFWALHANRGPSWRAIRLPLYY